MFGDHQYYKAMKLESLQLSRNQLTIILSLVCASLWSQNFLYSTEQFGIDGAMLGGAVVAGTDDVSMTFYNPASIHEVPTQFSVSVIQPRVRTFGFREFWGNNQNSPLDRDFSQKPDLISFKFKIKNLDIAFLKISKSDFSDVFTAEQESLTADRKSTQYFDYEYRGEDDWFGLGTNFKLGPKLYFGVSQFVRNFDFSYRNRVFSEELDVNQTNQLTQFFDFNFDGSYGNIGAVTKIGFLLDTKVHDIGFTVTTPTYLRLIKGGDFFNVRANSENGEIVVDQVIDNEIDPTIATPWEFNLGYSLTLNPNQKIWLNTSYHTKIREYTMATIETLGSTTDWRNGSKAVFNYAVGYSHSVNANLHLSAAVRTNNFAYENSSTPQGTVRNTIFDGNHIHYVIGSKFNFNRSTILLGVDYGTIRNIPEEGNFQQFSNIDVLTPNLDGLKKNNLSILLTYGFILDSFRKAKD